MPPIATTGTRATAQIARSPARASGAAASAFDGVSQTGPGAEVVGVCGPGLLERGDRAAEQEAARPCAGGTGIALAEVHPLRSERECGIDVIVDDERDTELRESCSTLDDLVRRPLHPQLHDGGSGCNGSTCRLQIVDERMHLHDVRAFASSVAGSSAASESYSAT